MQGRGRALEDRALLRVDMQPARVARVRRPRLGRVELTLTLATWAVRVQAVRGEAIPPSLLKARRIVREHMHELHQRVVPFRGLTADRVIPVAWRSLRVHRRPLVRLGTAPSGSSTSALQKVKEVGGKDRQPRCRRCRVDVQPLGKSREYDRQGVRLSPLPLMYQRPEVD